MPTSIRPCVVPPFQAMMPGVPWTSQYMTLDGFAAPQSRCRQSAQRMRDGTLRCDRPRPPTSARGITPRSDGPPRTGYQRPATPWDEGVAIAPDPYATAHKEQFVPPRSSHGRYALPDEVATRHALTPRAMSKVGEVLGHTQLPVEVVAEKPALAAGAAGIYGPGWGGATRSRPLSASSSRRAAALTSPRGHVFDPTTRDTTMTNPITGSRQDALQYARDLQASLDSERKLTASSRSSLMSRERWMPVDGRGYHDPSGMPNRRA